MTDPNNPQQHQRDNDLTMRVRATLQHELRPLLEAQDKRVADNLGQLTEQVDGKLAQLNRARTDDYRLLDDRTEEMNTTFDQRCKDIRAELDRRYGTVDDRLGRVDKDVADLKGRLTKTEADVAVLKEANTKAAAAATAPATVLHAHLGGLVEKDKQDAFIADQKKMLEAMKASGDVNKATDIMVNSAYNAVSYLSLNGTPAKYYRVSRVKAMAITGAAFGGGAALTMAASFLLKRSTLKKSNRSLDEHTAFLNEKATKAIGKMASANVVPMRVKA